MRALLVWLVLLPAMLPAAGCVTGDHGAVLLHLDQASADLVLPSTYSASATGVGPADTQFLFTATSNQGLLQVLLPSPLHTGDTIALPGDAARVRFQLADAEWDNQGGSVYVIAAAPPIIALVAVPMTARSGSAGGSFVFNGNGTFRCADSNDRCVVTTW